MVQPRILVTGGAGYIGSHVVKALACQYSNIIVYDNLSTGHRDNVSHAKLIVGDLLDINHLKKIFLNEKINIVIHFAAKTSISESFIDPLSYYENNVQGTLNLLKCCALNRIKAFLFSSSAAVYGHPQLPLPLRESDLINPISPYGSTKAICERLIIDMAHSIELPFVNLRYFNVAGYDLNHHFIQRKQHANFHLIKLAVQAALNLRKGLPVYGLDYPTEDGTCVRDYIHISDLVKAHILSLEYLLDNQPSVTLNCGYGEGLSVKSIIKRVQELTGHPFPVTPMVRREGDAPVVVASNALIKALLKWQPKYNKLDYILKTTIEYEKQRVLALT